MHVGHVDCVVPYACRSIVGQQLQYQLPRVPVGKDSKPSLTQDSRPSLQGSKPSVRGSKPSLKRQSVQFRKKRIKDPPYALRNVHIRTLDDKVWWNFNLSSKKG